jgi:hypothetical protein
MVTDRVKKTLPDHCLKHVLTFEGDTWFNLDRLTHVFDVYTSSHLSDGKPRGGDYKQTYSKVGNTANSDLLVTNTSNLVIPVL